MAHNSVMLTQSLKRKKHPTFDLLLKVIYHESRAIETNIYMRILVTKMKTI